MFPDQANITDSPDLGPPPVGHFEDGEPGVFEQAREVNTEDESTQRTLFAHLETRKRRRETSNIVQSKAHEVIDHQPQQPRTSLDKITPPIQSLKSGAKRKISVTEDESRSEPRKSPRDDDVMVNHKYVMTDPNKSGSAKPNTSRTGHPTNNRASRESNGEGHQGKSREARVTVVTKNRKALGPSELILAKYPDIFALILFFRKHKYRPYVADQAQQGVID